MKITTKDMILVSLFTALSAIGAFIKIPFTPAPITLQFFFTALAGILLGSKLGATSQIVYVALGLAGAPVFTKPSGPSYIFEPTFGYLIGFIISAYVIGKVVETYKNCNFQKLMVACILGLIAMYAIGVPYLYIILKYVTHTSITFMTALKSGFILFIPGDLVKCIVTSIIGVRIIPILKNQIIKTY